ncbi:MAG: YkgJ family cysteine cluster protein [Thermodesulfobacteriota bacterium]
MKTKHHEQWEAICRKCGKCCYEKVDLGGGVIHYTDEPCIHLDTETRLCKVYDRRHEVEPDCISLTEDLVRNLHWLPEDCAYVQYVEFLDTIAAVRNAEKKRAKRKGKRRR